MADTQHQIAVLVKSHRLLAAGRVGQRDRRRRAGAEVAQVDAALRGAGVDGSRQRADGFDIEIDGRAARHATILADEGNRVTPHPMHATENAPGSRR